MLQELLPSLLFGSSVLAFALVVWWAIQNDAPGNAGGERGLFAIRHPDGKETDSRRAPGWRRGGRSKSTAGHTLPRYKHTP